MSRYGAPQFSSLLKDCVLWYTGEHSAAATIANTITANGNVTQTTAVLDPWGEARPVGYFDGNGDYLTIPIAPFNNFGSSNFTIEGFIYIKNMNVVYSVLDAHRTVHEGYGIWINGSNDFIFQIATSSASWHQAYKQISSGWHHFAGVRNGTNLTIYIDGVGSTLSNVSGSIIQSGATHLRIGLNQVNEDPFNGYLSEFRISSIARYTSNFTPPTIRFKPDAYTKLLLHMYGSGATFTDDPFVDYDEFPILPSGVTVTNNGTFTKTSLGNNKSVLNFDGSTNYISLSDNDAWDLGSNNFTIVLWFNLSAISVSFYAFLTDYTSASSRYTLFYDNYYSGKKGIRFTYPSDGSGIDLYDNGYASYSASTWYNIAIVKSGSTFTMYRNGIVVATTTSSATITNMTGALYIGNDNSGYLLNGNIKDLMIFKGRALTQPEIKLLMNRTHPITGAGLMPSSGEYYRLS